MASTKEIDRLKARLQWERAGPLTDLSNQAFNTITERLAAFASWVRGIAAERPLIALLLALQAGFAVGRWGPRAKH